MNSDSGIIAIAILGLIWISFALGMKTEERETIKKQEQYQLCIESGASVEYCEKI